MTVSTNTSRWTATGNGATVNFTYTSKIFANTDLKVYIDSVLQTLTTHYSVSGVGVDAGGTVTFVTAPANGTAVLIVREVPYTQAIALLDGTKLPVLTLNNGYDRDVILAQQLYDLILRTLRQPEADIAAIGRLPLKADRLSKYLIFDSNGDPAAAGAPAGTTAVSAFGASLILAATAAAAQAILALTPGTNVQAFSALLAAIAALAGTKGQLIAGTGATFAGLAVGTNGQALSADSTQATGLKWAGLGKILQVVSATKTDTFTTANTAYTDVTGVSASITLSSTSSKVLVLCSGMLSHTVTADGAYAQIVRGATPINIGDVAGSRTVASVGKDNALSNENAVALGITTVDSPASVAAQTYKLQIRGGSAGTAAIGRTGTDTDNSDHGRYPTNLILMEIGP